MEPFWYVCLGLYYCCEWFGWVGFGFPFGSNRESFYETRIGTNERKSQKQRDCDFEVRNRDESIPIKNLVSSG
jgi:hypothetical protein